MEQVEGFLLRLAALPIEVVRQAPTDILALTNLANTYGLTSYDAAYWAAAIALNSPLATTDRDLRKAASGANVALATV